MFLIESLKMVLWQIGNLMFYMMMDMSEIFGYGWSFDSASSDETPWFLDLIISIWIPIATIAVFTIMIKRSIRLIILTIKAIKNELK